MIKNKKFRKIKIDANIVQRNDYVLVYFVCMYKFHSNNYSRDSTKSRIQLNGFIYKHIMVKYFRGVNTEYLLILMIYYLPLIVWETNILA